MEEEGRKEERSEGIKRPHTVSYSEAEAKALETRERLSKSAGVAA